MAIALNVSTVPPSFQHTPAAGKPRAPHEAFTFTADAGTNLLTSVGHGMAAGDPVRFTSDTTLPAGLAAGTTYYVIASGLTADAFKVSAALAGSEVDITDAGTGTHSAQFYLTAGEQTEYDTWLAYFTNGAGPLPAVAALPGAIALLNKLVGYYQSAVYKAWLNDDNESRDAQYRLRKADSLVANDATVPVSGDPGGEGSDPPVSPIERYAP